MRLLPLAVGVCLLAAGCTSGSAPRAGETAATAAAPSSASSPGALRLVGTTVSTGRRGALAYTLTLPDFTGPGSEEVEERVRRSADDSIAELAGSGDEVPATVESTAEVTVDDGRTVQVRLDHLYYADGAAHPVDTVSTVVLRLPGLRPVGLDDVFEDVDGALAAALRHARQVAADEGNDDPSGLTEAQDWADWQSTPDGITFSFDDGVAGSHAAGLRQVAVPWSVLRPWARDDAYALLGPPVS